MMTMFQWMPLVLFAFLLCPQQGKAQVLIDYAQFKKLNTMQQSVYLDELRKLTLELESLGGRATVSRPPPTNFIQALLMTALGESACGAPGQPCVHAGYISRFDEKNVCTPPADQMSRTWKIMTPKGTPVEQKLCQGSGQKLCNPLLYGFGPYNASTGTYSGFCTTSVGYPTRDCEKQYQALPNYNTRHIAAQLATSGTEADFKSYTDAANSYCTEEGKKAQPGLCTIVQRRSAITKKRVDQWSGSATANRDELLKSLPVSGAEEKPPGLVTAAAAEEVPAGADSAEGKPTDEKPVETPPDSKPVVTDEAPADAAAAVGAEGAVAEETPAEVAIPAERPKTDGEKPAVAAAADAEVEDAAGKKKCQRRSDAELKKIDAQIKAALQNFTAEVAKDATVPSLSGKDPTVALRNTQVKLMAGLTAFHESSDFLQSCSAEKSVQAAMQDADSSVRSLVGSGSDDNRVTRNLDISSNFRFRMKLNSDSAVPKSLRTKNTDGGNDLKDITGTEYSIENEFAGVYKAGADSSALSVARGIMQREMWSRSGGWNCAPGKALCTSPRKMGAAPSALGRPETALQPYVGCSSQQVLVCNHGVMKMIKIQPEGAREPIYLVVGSLVNSKGNGSTAGTVNNPVQQGMTAFLVDQTCGQTLVTNFEQARNQKDLDLCSGWFCGKAFNAVSASYGKLAADAGASRLAAVQTGTGAKQSLKSCTGKPSKGGGAKSDGGKS